MPAATGTKRVRVSTIEGTILPRKKPLTKLAGSFNIQTIRFVPYTQQSPYTRHAYRNLTKTIKPVFGSEAQPFDPNNKPEGVPPDHTHQWRVYVKGINDTDITYWLKKVQFKLHETYAQNVRTRDQPPFEVTETGWGEFEIQIKLYFVPESTEKPQTLWHSLKLHPYGPDADGKRERRDVIVSQNYEEVVFNEPVEQFYDILTGGNGMGQPAQMHMQRGKGGGKHAKMLQQQVGNGGGRTAEIPFSDSPGNPYSRATESTELDRLAEAGKTVEQMIKEERERLVQREKKLAELRESEGVPPPTKKK